MEEKETSEFGYFVQAVGIVMLLVSLVLFFRGVGGATLPTVLLVFGAAGSVAGNFIRKRRISPPKF